jgi:tRNA pseudouridine32 synthase/23S rRNA pseudouridine746 synthase
MLPPMRDGVGPSCVGLPAGPWPTLLDFLVQRFPGVAAEVWRQRMARGDVVDEHGQAVTPARTYQPMLRLYYYREVPDEAPIPFEETVLFQDEHLVVADKPHFLPVVPSGGYLQQTLLVRLKRRLGLADLVPLHRIDRDTAGLVLFSVKRATRGIYQALFRQHTLRKTYQATARWDSTLPWPLRRETRIGDSAHFMQQQELPGPPNTRTLIQPLAVHGTLARYQLQPVTGHRHQLRVHMNALGLPIVGDGIYPTLTPEGHTNPALPLQLLAQALEFTDPLTGLVRRFESERRLLALEQVSQLVDLSLAR